ncbi:mitochondrial calcium uniporter regulator 1 isoform X7 [Pipistrellus kuhlii]|uniref:mitochondrial calcium uniporter regulator 1 isoform X7 n=1 Tax=Pipistrellus kuhlii TaxID=59472 RepID=UPI00174F7982|nr:mitochondrial calcium uniporter regulator 1 isoform X7 [Pipistrellus kuhlii]
MDGGSVSGEGPKRPPDRRRFLLFLLASRCGSPGGVPARRCLSALAQGLEALGPGAPAARAASRASALCLLVQVPVPRRAAAAPRRPPGERERARLGPSAPPAGRCCAWRCQPGLVPGVACAAGPLHQCQGRVPALAATRRELSLSAGCLQLEHKRGDFTSSGSRKLYFDTHALVCLLEENGFTTQQAEIIVSALVKITEANMGIVYKDMVTKMQQKIKLELHQLKQQIMYSLNERKLLEMRTEMVALHAQQDRAVTQTDRKIDTEVAGLKTMLESHKLDNIKYLAGSVFTCLTVALGFYRLWI